MYELFEFPIRAKPTATSCTTCIYGRNQIIFFAFLHCHFFGVAIFVKQRNLVSFEPCKPFWFIFSNAYISNNIIVTKLLVVVFNRLYFAISVDYTHTTNGKAIEFALPFSLPLYGIFKKIQVIFLCSHHINLAPHFF